MQGRQPCLILHVHVRTAGYELFECNEIALERRVVERSHASLLFVASVDPLCQCHMTNRVVIRAGRLLLNQISHRSIIASGRHLVLLDILEQESCDFRMTLVQGVYKSCLALSINVARHINLFFRFFSQEVLKLIQLIPIDKVENLLLVGVLTRVLTLEVILGAASALLEWSITVHAS